MILRTIDEDISNLLKDQKWYYKEDARDLFRELAAAADVSSGDLEEYLKEKLSDLLQAAEDVAAEFDFEEGWERDPGSLRKVTALVAYRLSVPQDEVKKVIEEFSELQKEGYIRKIPNKNIWCVYSHTTGRCFGCFVAGTDVVRGDGGLKPIEEVEPEEFVLTHKGRPRRVVATSKRWHSGPVLKLRFWGRSNDIVVTPEHPFLLRLVSGTCACGCGEPLSFSSIARGGRFKPGHNSRSNVSASEIPIELFEAVEWKEVGDLVSLSLEDRKGVYGLVPRIKTAVRPPDVTPGKARLLGVFLAEGSYAKYSYSGEKYGLSFAFGENERELIAEVKQLLESEFGVLSNVTLNTGRSLELRTTISGRKERCKEAVMFFEKYAGEYARSKRLPESVLFWDGELLQALLRGWIDGDGSSSSPYELSVTTTSKTLASQMSMLLSKMGVRHSASFDEVRSSNFSDRYICHTLTIHGKEGLVEGTRDSSGSIFPLDDFMALRLRSVEVIPDFEGWVYNLEVEEDHSYLVYGVSVHNCYRSLKKARERLRQMEMFKHIKKKK